MKAIEHAFDRDTGAPIDSKYLKTYRDALAQYHIHSESKFQNGEFADHGPTERRHITATAIAHIGKEANRWEEQFYLGLDPEAQPTYGMAVQDRTRLLRYLGRAAKSLGLGKLAGAAHMSRQQVAAILLGKVCAQDGTTGKLIRAADEIAGKRREERAKAKRTVAAIRNRVKKLGLTATAASIDMDKANLSSVLTGRRKLPKPISRLIGGKLID